MVRGAFAPERGGIFVWRGGAAPGAA